MFTFNNSTHTALMQIISHTGYPQIYIRRGDHVVYYVHMKKHTLITTLCIIIGALAVAGIIAIVIGPRDTSVSSEESARQAGEFLRANTRAEFGAEDMTDTAEFLRSSTAEMSYEDGALLDEYFRQ